MSWTLKLSVAALFLNVCLFEQVQAAEPVKRIAHAGGGFRGETYTNSIDALNHNAASYDFFEIDFSWTSDGELVCLHDWQDSAETTFGRRYETAPTLEAFERMVADNRRYKNCTVKTLTAWLDRNPDAMIVTDFKHRNVAGLAYLADSYAGFARRFIPQIYQPKQYQPVRDLGYSSIIWTLYAYRGSNADILSEVEGMDLYAVTMSRRRAGTGLALALDRLGVKTYAHTINDDAELAKLRSLGIDEVYTDWLIAKP